MAVRGESVSMDARRLVGEKTQVEHGQRGGRSRGCDESRRAERADARPRLLVEARVHVGPARGQLARLDRITPEEALDELDDSEPEAHRRQRSRALGDHKLGAAPADVEEPEGTARSAETPGGAQEGQLRFRLATHDAGTDPGLRLETSEERAPVARLASGGGRDQQDLRGSQGLGAVPVAADGHQGPLDGFRGERAARRESFAEARDGLVGPKRDEPGGRIGLGDEKADGVRTEIDPGEKPAHLGRAEARPRSVATVARSVSRPTGFSTTVSIP